MSTKGNELQLLPADLRDAASALGRLSGETDEARQRLRGEWSRLDAGWECYAEQDVNACFDPILREIGRMSAMLSQMGQAMVKTADLVEAADQTSAALFDLRATEGGKSPGWASSGSSANELIDISDLTGHSGDSIPEGLSPLVYQLAIESLTGARVIGEWKAEELRYVLIGILHMPPGKIIPGAVRWITRLPANPASSTGASKYWAKNEPNSPYPGEGPGIAYYDWAFKREAMVEAFGEECVEVGYSVIANHEWWHAYQHIDANGEPVSKGEWETTPVGRKYLDKFGEQMPTKNYQKFAEEQMNKSSMNYWGYPYWMGEHQYDEEMAVVMSMFMFQSELNLGKFPHAILRRVVVGLN